MTVSVREFADRGAQATALADEVAAVLRRSLKAGGRASLAVPGGTTPGAFLSALGARPLDWAGVAVTLTDERCVPATDERSNERLVRGTLVAAGAAAADFVPLYVRGAGVGPAIARVDEALTARALPFDAVVLGMGNDGHTASLFPGADRLDEALDPEDDASVIALAAPGASEPRISLTLPAILSADAIFLLIAGDDKKATLDRAMQPGPVAEAPVRAILSAKSNVSVYWAP